MDLTKILLFGVGGFLLWNYFKGQTLSNGNGETQSQVDQTLRNQMIANQGSNVGNWDRWNYHLNQIKGVYADMDVAGVVRVDPMPVMTVDQFLAVIANQGISGLRGIRVTQGLMGYANSTNSFERAQKKFRVM